MLLYAKTDEQLVPDNTFQMSGNTISVKTLDLNQDFIHIAKQLMILYIIILRYKIVSRYCKISTVHIRYMQIKMTVLTYNKGVNDNETHAFICFSL